MTGETMASRQAGSECYDKDPTLTGYSLWAIACRHANAISTACYGGETTNEMRGSMADAFHDGYSQRKDEDATKDVTLSRKELSVVRRALLMEIGRLGEEAVSHAKAGREAEHETAMTELDHGQSALSRLY